MSSPLHTPEHPPPPDRGEGTVIALRPVPEHAPPPRDRMRGSGPRAAHVLLEGSGWTPLRVFVDAVMAVLAVVAAVRGAGAAGLADQGAEALYLLPLLIVASLALRGMYRRRVHEIILDGVGPVVGAVSVSAMLVVTWSLYVGADSEIGALIARAWVFSVVFVGAGRVCLTAVQRQARRRGEVARTTLIIGAGEVGAQVARRLNAHPEFGLMPVGFLDADPAPHVERTSLGVPILGTPADLRRVAADVGAQHVILAFSSAPDRGLIPVARECELLGLEVSLVPRLFESMTDRVALERLGGLPLVGLRSVDPQGWKFTFKYGLDRVLAAVALLLVAPVFAAIAVTVKLSSPGPVLFRQLRVGRDGQVFHLLKFRSMRPAESNPAFRPAPGSAPGGIEGVDRRTAVGRLIRRTALDELPQLINVVRGEMSLVGPRPERPEFVELFRHDVARYGDRHRVKSGITGWAQVHGLRGQTSLADRVEWDNFYIENWSLWLDVKILLMTFVAIFRASD
jgi:exopolysaccharide biosynthesis polyprenyl glycosylphosphotransferase